jgi:membrane-associated protease RseP (regulator of RpoE activity)
VSLSPGPPEDVYWLSLESAKIPARKIWDDRGGKPDPFVVLHINGREVMRSASVADSLQPVWKGPQGNFAFDRADEVVLELVDSDPIRSLPMGSATLSPPTAEQLAAGKLEVEVMRHGQVTLAVAPARAMYGLGFDYAVFGDEVVVRRVMKHSPAGRAGMRPGDRIVSIGERKVKGMTSSQVKSVLAVPLAGVQIIVRHDGGTTEAMTLSEGPLYPLYQEYGSVR